MKMEQFTHHADVIVVGGGMAGMVAARDLSQAGLTTVLLEARDRLGGRTNTVDFCGKRVESGGTFFDLDHEPPVVEEFTRYSIPTWYKKDVVVFRTLLNGTVYPVGFPIEQAEDLIRIAYRGIHDSYRIDIDDPQWPEGLEDLDVPFPQWLESTDLPRETWEYVNAWVSTYSGNLPDAVSALTILGPYIAGLDHSPWGWYYNMSHEIAGGSEVYRRAVVDDSPGLTIRLSTPVAKVERGEDVIRLTARSGEIFTADDVVWATPLNTWSDIEFVPELGAEKAAAARVKHIGKHQKLWMRVRNVPTGIYSISYESPFKMLIHHDVLQDGESLIFAMTEHTQLDMDDHDAIEAALRKLVPEAELLETFYEDWLKDEFSQGTWMVPPPGFLTKYGAHLETPEGRLRFAGADVNLRWLSWMPGAIVSGAKAAADIIARRTP
jgi:monoamine oxidase